MSAGERFFVTPHAVERFRQRIARVDYNEALTLITHGLTRPYAVRRTLRRDGVPAWEIAVVGAHRFIATVVPNRDTGLLPAVVSIRYGTKGGNRKPEYERSTWTRLSTCPNTGERWE